MSTAEIREAALKLSDEEKVRLAEELLASLDGSSDILSEDDPQLEAELLRRMNDPRPGIETTPEFWDDIKRRAKDRQRDSGQKP